MLVKIQISSHILIVAVSMLLVWLLLRKLAHFVAIVQLFAKYAVIYFYMRYHYEDFHQGAKFDTEFIISDLEKRNILNSNKI